MHPQRWETIPWSYLWQITSILIQKKKIKPYYCVTCDKSFSAREEWRLCSEIRSFLTYYDHMPNTYSLVISLHHSNNFCSKFDCWNSPMASFITSLTYKFKDSLWLHDFSICTLKYYIKNYHFSIFLKYFHIY